MLGFMIDVCVAGITGWVGAPLADAVRAADDLRLVAGVARGGAGTTVHGAAGVSVWRNIASLARV